MTTMSTDPREPREPREPRGTRAPRGPREPRGSRAGRIGPRHAPTETKGAFQTTEFAAYVAVLVALLIAALIVDDDGPGGFGARQVWLYVTVLTFGYMLSRGLAKSGSRRPFDDDDRP
jgi:hypothetical protein